MGLVRIRKPEGLVSREVRSKARSENAIRKCDSTGRDSQVRSTSVIQKCDQDVRLTTAIDRSTGATYECDQQVRVTSAID